MSPPVFPLAAPKVALSFTPALISQCTLGLVPSTLSLKLAVANSDPTLLHVGLSDSLCLPLNLTFPLTVFLDFLLLIQPIAQKHFLSSGHWRAIPHSLQQGPPWPDPDHVSYVLYGPCPACAGLVPIDFHCH